ncbi:DUF3800 domain-containing protein [Mesorhizobium sp. M1A.F.Ca.IN.020.03.2.1]|uniref:DUF3800 domain-containing protein n=1 Tax=Mesorhizobium sp. M1A.F.Ca.IN.020.03.2.1 TaxID=2496769 RepID=UPI000FD4D786|nr:DUF3800 domain-containing protein [Mesorhizobium sp. M1A.F.Ca.IN.020.03.2.1]RUV00544.1 DUF3800 domain-containing protein [Mesorhizobium sp. M1A.F.Ca.IN.020.03.2.1]
MPQTLNLYLDDSGTKHPTRDPGKKPEHGYDWFALGGILTRSDEENAARKIHQDFCERWPITAPLHSSEIRSQNEGFGWIRGLSAGDRGRFYEELYVMMRDAPVIGIACTIDRPGYNARYLEMYQKQPWLLCRTAFSVVVERAAKFARSKELRLRVFAERCNKTEDRLLKSYYDALRAEGQPFAKDNSGKYAPLTAAEFAETLYEFQTKAKTSPMAQLADLFLWPICMGGYHASNRPYRRLIEDGKLIECHLKPEDWHMLASKYSCFEKVERRA